jgi:very-short-patch-repair endonuclease
VAVSTSSHVPLRWRGCCLLWLLGGDVLPSGAPALEVVVPRGAVVPERAGLRARTADVPADDHVLVEPGGIPALRPGRAVADLLRLLSLREAVVVADAVLHAELCSHDQLADELVRHARLRGVRQARQALELSDARAESPPESRLRLDLVRAGLSPVPQHVVLDAFGRFVARVDLAFPSRKIAIEYDGRAVHEREDVFVRDRQRQNALLALGWLVLRYTYSDLAWGSARVVDEVRVALARRTAA